MLALLMLLVLVLTRDIISTASILQTDIYIVFQYNQTGSIKQGIITIPFLLQL